MPSYSPKLWSVEDKLRAARTVPVKPVGHAVRRALYRIANALWHRFTERKHEWNTIMPSCSPQLWAVEGKLRAARTVPVKPVGKAVRMALYRTANALWHRFTERKHEWNTIMLSCSPQLWVVEGKLRAARTVPVKPVGKAAPKS